MALKAQTELEVLFSAGMAAVTLFLLVIIVVFARRFCLRALAKQSIDSIPSASGQQTCDMQTGLWAFLTRGPNLMHQGYQSTKATTGIFKIPVLNHWWVVLTSESRIEELVRSKDNSLSSLGAVDYLMQLSSSLGSTILTNPYHLTVIQTHLNKRLDYFIPEILDEVPLAFERALGTGSALFTPHAIFSSLICQISNRMLVGPSKCRDEEYIRINVKFASRVVTLGHILSYVPVVFRSFVARLIYSPSDKHYLYKHLKPLIDERRASLDNGTDNAARSDDYLTWLVEATRAKPDDMDIVLRNLHMNFASIHTTELICTHMFYFIGCNQAWQIEIRDEALTAIKKHGWTKKALGDMVKADSFIKEILRFQGISSMALTRMAVKPFTFSDSTAVPAGTMFCAASRAIHFDSAKWAKPDEFDPFRFCRGTRTELDGMVTTSYDFLAWGHGRYACPGRFFASYELKAVLAHALLNYDIFLQGGACPKLRWFVAACTPDGSAILDFRRRLA